MPSLTRRLTPLSILLLSLRVVAVAASPIDVLFQTVAARVEAKAVRLVQTGAVAYVLPMGAIAPAFVALLK